MSLLAAILLMCHLVTADGPARFADVTAGSGVPPLKYAEGVNLADIDGDGLPELFLPDVKGPDRLFKNKGGFRFEDVTAASGIKEKGGIGAVFGDLNGDGLADLYVVRGAYPYGLNKLYLKKPDGHFEDVSEAAGVAGRKNGISAVMADFMGSGRLDIFVANWGTNTLYRNDSAGGRVAFTDVTKKAGLDEEGRSWGAVISDFNGDGLRDIFVVRGSLGKGEDQKLYINRGDGTFEDRTAGSGLKGVTWSMGAVSADFDGDGDFDLFVTSYDGPDRIYLNDGKGHFTDATAASGIASGHSVGAAAGDIDGDLLPDLVVAGWTGPVLVYKNMGGGKFALVNGSGVGRYKKNEGVALADIDGDGALDLYVANYDGFNRLYRNGLAGMKSVKVRPVYCKRPAIGAVARIYKSGGLGREDALLASQELQAGFGFCSQSPAELLFALPDGRGYDLRVEFPGGSVVDVKGVKPGALLINGGR
jgi:hypothetical protein